MHSKTKKIRYIFFIYWFLLAYIIAALVWWFIELNRQNEQMTIFELQQLQPGQQQYNDQVRNVQQIQKRKTAQYFGEGLTFFLLIAAGAVFVFRAVRRQLKISQQQQNFMMALTHELKTPIAVTKLNLETLQKRKLEEISLFSRQNQTSPIACIRLFPLKMTMRLFIVTSMPMNSITCFVIAHLLRDTFIRGAI